MSKRKYEWRTSPNEKQQQNEEQQQNEDQMKWKTTTSQKSNISKSFWLFDFKKMITEVLLMLPVYLILFFIWWQFQHLIKIMADVGDILNVDDFFGDVIDTPREGIERHKKWECLKSVIDKDKAHLLGHKWTHERVNKVSDKTINKTYAN